MSQRQVDWSAVRDDYESGKFSQSELERKYRVSRRAISKRAVKEKWSQVRSQVPPSGNPGNNTRDIDALMRAHMALKIYFEERPTWDEIADRSGFASRGAAHNAVRRELTNRIDRDVQNLRDEELFMLQSLQARAYKDAMDENNKNWSWSADRVVNISKRKSELMGLDKRPEEELANQNYTKRIILTHGENSDASSNQ